MIEHPLFENDRLYLCAVNLEKDPGVETYWTYDLDLASLYRKLPLRPMSPFEINKYYEELIKRSAEKGDLFHFSVHWKYDDRLIGFVRIQNIHWSNGAATFVMAVGDPDYKGKVERDLLVILLKYVFHELNLYRLQIAVPEYDRFFIELLEEMGFKLEACQRQSHYRQGKFCNWLRYGILCSEWIDFGKEAV